MTMPFPQELYDYLSTHTLIKVKGGRTRLKFLEIWMVEVEGRLFSRTWNKSAKSWYTAFLEEGVGQIKFGEEIIDVRGQRLEVDQELTRQINEAYLKKYNQPFNISYAKGITQPEYEKFTMEFLSISPE